MNNIHQQYDMTYGQVWWPIFGICALQLTHPSAHTQQWTNTHTQSSGQPFLLRRPGSSWGLGALLRGTSLWYWRGSERWLFTPPTYNPCQRLKLATFGIRVRLSNHWATTNCVFEMCQPPAVGYIVVEQQNCVNKRSLWWIVVCAIFGKSLHPAGY